MKTKRIISAFLTLIMLFGSLTVVADAAWADKVDENEKPLIDYLTKEYKTAEEKLADMVMVKEQYGYQLWFEEFTGEVAVRDTATGQVTFSNPIDIASKEKTIAMQTKQKLLSQLIITYLENDVQKTMYSYVEAALRGQIVMKNIKNGIRVEYTLGEEQAVRLVPRMIRADRFEELILNNIDNDWDLKKLRSYYELKDKSDPTLTDRAIALMQAKYPITIDMAVYICTENINSKELRTCEEIIKTYCPNYTYEDLDADHEETGYVGTDAAPPRFKMALEYVLNDTGIEVRLPANGITFDESTYQLQTVSMLPYFGAGNNKYTGYAVIPDGSGALIRFEDFAGGTVNIAGQLYGPDYAYHEIYGQHSETMTMPYYGVVTNYGTMSDSEVAPDTAAHSDGFVAIIEEGDSLASLMAECGGTLHPYNTVYATFTPRPSDQYNLADSISVSGNATWTVTSKRKYTDSYRIRYILLKDEEAAAKNNADDYYRADWVGMAEAYRDYLIDSGDIVKIADANENIPLFIETFGSIKTTERVMSFPIEVDLPLTTFEDIKTMKSELSEAGIDNVNFKLTGYANGGLEATVPYRLKWVDVLGGAAGFSDLVQYAADNDFDIYPDFDFAYVSNQAMFDGINLKEHAVRTIDDRFTTRRTYNAATQTFSKSFSIAIAPSAYEYLYDSFGVEYISYKNDSISVSTLGTDLNSDFDEDEPYHREDDKQFTRELLARLDNDYNNVMIDGGNAYAIKYADIILNAALTSSKYVKTSQSIPFLGMVYHGSKVFTGTATNMEGDINESILNAIENGATMYFILSYQNTSELKESETLSKYYSVSYDIWKDDVAKYYNILNSATADLQESFIVDHEFLDAARVPDPEEIEAEKLAAEAALEEAAKAQLEALEKAARDARRAARLAGEPIPEIEITPPVITPAIESDEFVIKDKYKTTCGTVVRVEYEGNVNFLLNYNSYEIEVMYDGVVYTVPALSFIRID